MTTTSTALDAYEAFIREKVEIEMWTHTQVSEALKKEMHSCQVSWFDQDSPGFVMPVLVLFWLREKY